MKTLLTAELGSQSVYLMDVKTGQVGKTQCSGIIRHVDVCPSTKEIVLLVELADPSGQPTKIVSLMKLEGLKLVEIDSIDEIFPEASTVTYIDREGDIIVEGSQYFAVYKTNNLTLGKQIRDSLVENITSSPVLNRRSSDFLSTQGKTSGLVSPEKEPVEYQDSPQPITLNETPQINKEELNKIIDYCLSPAEYAGSEEDIKQFDANEGLIKIIDNRITLFKMQLKQEISGELDKTLKVQIKNEISAFFSNASPQVSKDEKDQNKESSELLKPNMD